MASNGETAPDEPSRVRSDISGEARPSGIVYPTLGGVADAFDAAERCIKRTESSTGELPVPPINELRYAASHMLCALSGNSGERFDSSFEAQDHHDSASHGASTTDELRRAVDHCRRARYDAIDLEVLHFMEAVRLVKRDYRLVYFTGDTEKRFNELLVAARKAESLAKEARQGVGVGSKRADYVDALDNQRAALAKAIEDIEGCRHQLNAQKLRQWLTVYIAITVSTLAMLFGAVKTCSSSTASEGVAPDPASRQGAPLPVPTHR